ncbi:uncharacterized protein N7479_004916 [Penicillium vulpinum]|uniref:uncharacterized protein n=1 Tax=Penicillium vulpinum TaxID=29845 RepID=UPI002548682D|nr:uncharacterized protein N7479_004916 [Penicillium vulpinum]KAJ5965040.1 hypothetical protein N7479_004916 [Penicillium vulpinum]
MSDSILRRAIRRFLEHKIDTQEMARILETPEKPEPLAVTSLSLRDIEKILGLTQVMDDEFDFVVPIPVPQDLKLWSEKSDRAYGSSCANEASIRCKLNLLLICAHDLVSSSTNKSARPLAVQKERIWAYSPVEWEGKIRMLWGRPDYGVWYGEKEDFDLNLVIMEAKRPNCGTQGVPQALAYMDTTVYGISTDTMNFTFMKLDNESRWSFKPVGVGENSFEQVLGLLVYIMEKAASMSPATSKGTSRRTQQGSGESDLIFDHIPEMDDEMDVE